MGRSSGGGGRGSRRGGSGGNSPVRGNNQRGSSLLQRVNAELRAGGLSDATRNRLEDSRARAQTVVDRLTRREAYADRLVSSLLNRGDIAGAQREYARRTRLLRQLGRARSALERINAVLGD